MQRSLTPKQQRFIEEYLVDLNATQAAIRAGYSEKTAEVIGYQLLHKTLVQKAVEQEKAKRSDRNEINADYVLRQAVKLHERCMQDIRPFTDRKGKQIQDEEGNDVFLFDSRGAAAGLRLVGEHVGVKAFQSGPKGKLTIDTDASGSQRITVEFINTDTDPEGV